MPEVAAPAEQQLEQTTTTDFFNTDNWKSSPTIPVAASPVQDPVIEEKDKQIEIEKPVSDKPDEPEKIPTATPAPVQDRPENTDPKTKEDEPLKFANEESEKVFNLLREGKIDDVYNIISEQKKLSNVDKMPPADIIKLNLQYQNKEFTPQEVQELFEDTYTMPEKPVQSSLEDDDDFKERMGKYEDKVKRVEARIAREAKVAASELQKLSKEIVLPNIPNNQAAIKEPTQEELAELQRQSELFLQEVEKGLNSFEGYSVTYKDEEVSIPVNYKLSKEEKAALQPIIALSNTNAGEFFAKLGWIDDKGNVNTQKLSEDLPFILDKKAVLQKMVTETGNRRHVESLKAMKNIDYSGKAPSNTDNGKTPEQVRQGFENAFFV